MFTSFPGDRARFDLGGNVQVVTTLIRTDKGGSVNWPIAEIMDQITHFNEL